MRPARNEDEVVNTWQKVVRGGAVVLALGCSSEPSRPTTVVVAGDGLLTVEWTVDGTSDPNECAVEGADGLDLSIEDRLGAVVAEVTDVCEAGSTSVDLSPGSYFADAALIDAAGHSITTRVDLGAFTIRSGGESVLDADFPSDSFY